MYFRKYLFALLCLLFALELSAQELLPFVKNFSKSEYTGDNQVWSITQANDNTIYFANHHYFLRYNGVKWEKYSLPNKTIIRSVFADGNRIYCGSYKEFGYWERVAGIMIYKSISADKDLFTGNAVNEEIWKIFKHNDAIYFQSFNQLYRYNNGTVIKIELPTQISYCYTVDDTIYAASVRNGVYKMQNDTFSPVDAWGDLKDNIIHGIVKRNNKTYVFTKSNGVYIAENKNLKPWSSPINNILKNNVVLSVKFVNDNLLAVGTSLQGLYLINLKDDSYKNINRQNALRNNAVLSITLDSEKNLWLGLDNGISHIEVNSPISIFTDNSGLLGSVYSLASLNKGYILGSNHGVFTYDGKNLETIPNSQGQVWDIYQHKDNYIIGHNDGTFVYSNNKIDKINNINGGWDFLNTGYEDAYFQANYSGIVVYNDINELNRWKIIDSIAKPIRNIAQNRIGELWAADSYRGLYRIVYDKNFDVKRVDNISKKNNLNNDYSVKLFNYKNEILFFIDNIWYTYNRIEDKLIKNNVFNDEFKNINDIIPVDNDSFIVIRDGYIYLITQEGNNFYWKLLLDKYYQGRLIIENTQVYKKENWLLINLDDGFLAFNPKNNIDKDPKINIEAFYNGQLIAESTQIKYNQPVEINIISEYYGYNRPDLFYKLNEGDLKHIIDGKTILNNLNSGTQQLIVYYNKGGKQITVGKYEFSVAKPWYFSSLMIIVYIAGISGIFFLYYRWNKIRYLQKIRLNEEELRHRREILELEMEAENKLREQEYEKKKLEVEIQTKASEVAGKSLSIAKHSEMIDKIQEVLSDESEVNQLKAKVKKVIKSSSINKNEWQSFEKNLIKSHEDFVKRLTKKHPSLTPKDIKLCIYLKMNLSSKEIAPLMSISYRGVELHRYRLRKKIDLPTEESLSKFMIAI
ncbi:histidine kinase [Flavobacterium arcticum]|uniref:Histidine kinase n=1 Tax=Flavobacterium arcticum TaxID=1784713 RepID=A0A345H9V5_9FLAO|nr:histidine kinase [Flavobacterium arcticum]AXG73365.1 histidine kinase [Flavobacterium arcticum]KAF2513158.1 histidine kinase [Flavobacterium arcticum]